MLDQLTSEEKELLKTILKEVMAGSSCSELGEVVSLYKKLFYSANKQHYATITSDILNLIQQLDWRIQRLELRENGECGNLYNETSRLVKEVNSINRFDWITDDDMKEINEIDSRGKEYD